MTLAEVADAVRGRLDEADPSAPATGLTIDSRSAGPGQLFAALPGERVDGHDFAAGAVANGAVAVLATRPVGVPAVLVDDVQTAMADLAREALRRLPDIRVVALTGSAGKTSTKDLIAQVLAIAGPTVAPPGSFNNDLGVPLTVLQCDADTRFLVLEMGARGLGHIARLCRIAPPAVGVVLNVGSAHLGEFGSREAIAWAKGEIIEATCEVAVLNADDALVSAMRSRTADGVEVRAFGESSGADVRADGIDLDDLGRPFFDLSADGTTAPVRLQTYGEHQVPNALAAATVGLACGLDLLAVADALSAAAPRSHWRMEVTKRADGLTVINDAYNANPESMRAALKALVAIARGRRSWAVLGQMAELGPDARAEHEAIGRLAVRLGVDRLVVVGNEAAAMHAGAVLEGSWSNESIHVADVEEAVRVLQAEAAPDDVVLVKGSRVAGLERVAEAVLGPGAPPTGADRQAAGPAGPMDTASTAGTE
ncbi:MAG TPA: UDP-N-acetylmuramoyl-tripeptide--D-alanyl-D-alanine ligase [Frankiaceae bacterium]|nr:UDP-N-acetylmuramoyl-tripeptide--D-alanyl-D-alanine ligase [Frankiaceae bacterium]